jgi:hypothetical protein
MQNESVSKSHQMRHEDMVDLEHEGYRQDFGDPDCQSDNDLASQRVHVAAGSEATIEALELHPDLPATCYTPMERFLAESPMQAPHTWLARIAMNDMEGAEDNEDGDDAEELDARRYATEMANDDAVTRLVEETIVDSPRASSGTLSLAQCHETLGRPSQPVHEQCGGHVS